MKKTSTTKKDDTVKSTATKTSSKKKITELSMAHKKQVEVLEWS